MSTSVYVRILSGDDIRSQLPQEVPSTPVVVLPSCAGQHSVLQVPHFCLERSQENYFVYYNEIFLGLP